MKGRQLAASLALALAAGLWGIAFLLEPQQEVPEIAISSKAAEEGAAPSLSPGQAVPGGVSFRNRGRSGCRLRVKICTPELDGVPVLEAGDLAGEDFIPAGSGKESGECWLAWDGYLYYCNQRTDGLLLPGRETPAAYTAVRLNPSLGSQEVEALRLMGAEQLYVVVQAQNAEGGEWLNT